MSDLVNVDESTDSNLPSPKRGRGRPKGTLGRRGDEGRPRGSSKYATEEDRHNADKAKKLSYYYRNRERLLEYARNYHNMHNNIENGSPLVGEGVA